jgi:hypothetical protein
MSMLNTLHSPRYYTIFAAFDGNGEGFPFPDRAGDIGRNTYRGDSSYATDMRLQGVFNLGESVKAEASVEAFNLLNRPNINGIDTIYGPPLSRGRLHTGSAMGLRTARLRLLVPLISSLQLVRYRSQCG